MENISNSSLENDCKFAQILQMQNRIDQAIKKYVHVINSYETITRNEPNSFIDYSITAVSIGQLIEIYKNESDLDKALSLLPIQKKFIDHIAAAKQVCSNGDQIEKQEFIESQKQNILLLFDQFNEALEKPSAPPKKKPEEVINDFLKEKKKQDNKIAEQNMLRLLHLVEEKKKRLENSRLERWSDWINNNPVAMLIFAMIFLGLFLIFIFAQFKFDDDRPSRKINNRKRQNQKSNENNVDNTETSNLNSDSTPKLTKEEIKELSEKLKKVGDAKLQQKLNMHKKDFDEFVNQMKKRYQENHTKSQEL